MSMLPSPPLRRRPRRDLGFSLVEVLMAASVLAIGMLGIAAMQVVTLRGGTDSRARQTAAAVGNGTLDMISSEGRIVALDKYTVNAASMGALSTGTNITQTFTSSTPPVAAGPASVIYTAASWTLAYDANGAAVAVGAATAFYAVAVTRTEPVSYGAGATQSVNFQVKVTWKELNRDKTLTLNRYIMY
jgi:prepilin-type N-terminal cleavage/methylation domain-containing protein